LNRSKHITGECQHCGGHVEFLVEHIGMTAPCPHCGKETELLLATPADDSSAPRKMLWWTIAAIVILVLGLGASLVALKQAQAWAARRRQAAGVAATTSTNPASENVATEQNEQNGFKVSTITLEKAPGTSLVYAVGTVRDVLGKQRFGVRLELDLFDATNQKLGTAKDYQQVLEPGAEWRFKALVVQTKATSARLATVSEQP
jgi:hypothetical protein